LSKKKLFLFNSSCWQKITKPGAKKGTDDNGNIKKKPLAPLRVASGFRTDKFG
jgi:hypothetical protein